MIWTIVGGLLAVFAGFYLHARYTRGVCQSKADLTGKTVIITGGNTGIGYATAVDLAKRNAKVILACRRVDVGEQAAEIIRQETGNDDVKFKRLDLASLLSVRQFCTEINREEERIDILINNAGIAYAEPKAKTDDGLDCLIQTNYFGPFLLTNLLLDTIKKSSPSRIVNVSSIAHKWGQFDVDNINCEKFYPEYTIYSLSKLYNVMFSCELSRLLQGTGVTSNSLHPGTINSELFRTIPKAYRTIAQLIGRAFFKTTEEGAQTTIHCAVSETLERVSGKYFSECQEAQMSKYAQDAILTKALWDASELYTGLKS